MEQIIKDFIGICEAARLCVKSLHWGSKNMSTHKLMDDVANSLADSEDKISEASQGIIGKFEAGEIKAPELNITDPKEFIEYIIDECTEFHEKLEDKKFIGIRSEIEAMITNFNQFNLLIDYALHENKKSIKISENKLRSIVENAVRQKLMEDYNPNEYDDDPDVQGMKDMWNKNYGGPKAPEKAVKVSRPFKSGKYNYRLVLKPSKYNDGMVLHVEQEFPGRKAEYDKHIDPRSKHFNIWRDGGVDRNADDWDGVPSGWSYKPGMRHNRLTIDGGQNWVVDVPREAWEDLERQTESKENKKIKIKESELRSVVENMVRKSLKEGFGSESDGMRGFGPYNFDEQRDIVIVDKTLATILLDRYYKLEAFTEPISAFESEIDLADLGATYGDKAYNAVVKFITGEQWKDQYNQMKGVNEEYKYVKEKPNGKWGIIKKSTGEFIDADYDSKNDAEAGFRGMMANKYGN